MKKIIYLVITFSFLTLTALNAQNNLNHPSISNVAVSYQGVPQTTAPVNPAASLGVIAIPQGTINLVPGANISKIYFKIIDPQTSTVMYQVNYLINSAVVLNNNGLKLFENNNGVVFISPGQGMVLKPYQYQLSTEDSQQALTVIYSVTQ